jgi:hypothetical protein
MDFNPCPAIGTALPKGYFLKLQQLKAGTPAKIAKNYFYNLYLTGLAGWPVNHFLKRN